MEDIKFIKENAAYKGRCRDNFRLYLYDDILYIEGAEN